MVWVIGDKWTYSCCFVGVLLPIFVQSSLFFRHFVRVQVYYLDFSDCCHHLYCYIRNVSADVAPGLLQMLLVELENLLVELGSLHVVIGSLHGTSNRTLYLIHWGRLFSFRSTMTGYKCYFRLSPSGSAIQ